MPVFKIHHVTRYVYDRPVRESTNEMRIYPYPSPHSEVLMHELTVTGHPEVHRFSDYWNNVTGVFNIREPHTELSIDSRLIVRIRPEGFAQPDFNAGREALARETENRLELLELSLHDGIASQDAIDEIVGMIDRPWKGIAAMVQECSQYIYGHFKYIKGITDIESTVDEILDHRSGVCQDFAHVMLQILRTMRIPSRYVSGYVCPNRNGMRGVGATHAWVEAWIPGHGWAGIDPTNNVWVSDEHVPLAVGRHFSDCSPVRGTFKGPARQNLTVYVSVGYEDGHMFEDSTEVKVQPVSGPEPEPLPSEGLEAQQQQ